MWHSGLLTVMVALPFVGAVLAALLSPNARNVEAWLAGSVAVGGLLLTIGHYGAVANGAAWCVTRSTGSPRSAWR
jgi:multicomponent K+:H+ antiporter subunit A